MPKKRGRPRLTPDWRNQSAKIEIWLREDVAHQLEWLARTERRSTRQQLIYMVEKLMFPNGLPVHGPVPFTKPPQEMTKEDWDAYTLLMTEAYAEEKALSIGHGQHLTDE